MCVIPIQIELRTWRDSRFFIWNGKWNLWMVHFQEKILIRAIIYFVLGAQ